MSKQLHFKSLLLLLAMMLGVGTAWAEDTEIATATFNGKDGNYTAGWTTTGTGTTRTDCIVIGSGENITSPSFNLSEYDQITISIKARRFGSINGVATIGVAIGNESVGSVDATSTSATTSLVDITFTPTLDMTDAVLVFTCTNATSAGSTHGAGINTITITGTKAATSALTSIAVSGNYPTTFKQGAEFSHEGIIVTATYEDNTTQNVTSSAIFSEPDMTTTGTKTVTVSYTEGEVTKTTTYEITVEEALDYATLPFEWAGGSSADLRNVNGVTVNCNGTDYASSNAPYLVKFSSDGHYIMVKTDGQPGKVTIGVKMLGGNVATSITVQGSADGETFTDVQTLSISGDKNSILTLETTSSFAPTDRYVRLYFNKGSGSNVGIGPITIALPTTDPAIVANESLSLAYDATSGEIGYSILNPVAGTTLTATTEADWISDITVTDEKVTFTTTANTGEERTATITLTYGTLTKDVTVTQAAYEDPNAAGTEANPYTVAEAIAYINTLGTSSSATDVYVSGIISQVDSYNSTYKSITYWISDDGTTTNQMEVYSGKGLNGADFASVDDLQVGDIVTVKGKVKMYNTTPEFDMNSKIVSLQRNEKEDAGLLYEETEFTITIGEEFTVPTLTNPNNLTVTYASDNEAVATVNETTGEVTIVGVAGTAVITASFDGDDTYKAGSASYTLIVKKAAGIATDGVFDFTFADEIDYGTGLTPSTTDIKDATTFTAGNITLTVEPTKSGKYFRWYTGNPPTLRLYTDTKMTIAAPDGYVITNIDFVGTQNLNAILASTGTYEAAASKKTATWEGTAQSIEFVRDGANPFFTNITVTYIPVPESVSVTITDAGYATYCSVYPLDFSSTDIVPYVATMEGETVNFNPVSGGKVPAEVGILLGSATGTAAAGTYDIPVAASADAVESALIGVTKDTEVEAPIYVLMNQNGKVGFFLTQSTFTVSANTAYLPDLGSGARFIGINGEHGTTTGIAEIEKMRNAENVYNLNGQRMSKPTKGLYIVNGKKVAIK